MLSTQGLDAVEGEWLAEDGGGGADDFPILARLTGGEHRGPAALHAAFGVQPGGVLLGIGGAGEDDIGAGGGGVTMMALVDDEGVLADARGVEAIGTEQPERVHAAAHHGGEVEATGAGEEAQLQRGHLAAEAVQEVEAVPFRRGVGQRPGMGEQGCAIGAGECGAAEDDHGAFGAGEEIGVEADLGGGVGQVGRGADIGDFEAGQGGLADAGIDDRGFEPGIAADDEQPIRRLDAGDGGVEEVMGAVGAGNGLALLAAIEVFGAEGGDEGFQGEDRLGIDGVTDNGADAAAGDGLEAGGDFGERLGPGRGHEFAVAANPGAVEPAAFEAVEGEAAAIGQPFLVDRLILAGENAQHFAAAGVDADGGAGGVEHIDAVGLLQLPGAGDEGIGAGGQRADGADIDEVAGEFGAERFFDIGADFHRLAPAGGAEFGHAGHFGGEADAAGALDAARHHRFDERADILVLHRALLLVEAGAVLAIGHGLVLQVTFAALVADWAIERVVDQQEFHHAAAGVADHGGVGEDFHPLHHRIGAAGHRLGGFFDLDQAHAAIAGDREALMVAEARDFFARSLAGLEHGGAIGDFDFDAVYGDAGHVFTPPPSRCGRPCRPRFALPSAA